MSNFYDHPFNHLCIKCVGLQPLFTGQYTMSTEHFIIHKFIIWTILLCDVIHCVTSQLTPMTYEWQRETTLDNLLLNTPDLLGGTSLSKADCGQLCTSLTGLCVAFTYVRSTRGCHGYSYLNMAAGSVSLGTAKTYSLIRE